MIDNNGQSSDFNLDPKMALRFVEKFLPKFIVDFDLYDAYVKDERTAIEQLLAKIDEHSDDINSMNMLMANDFKESKQDLYSFINRTTDCDFQNFSKMFLFYSVSLFENMVDDFLQQELEFKGISIKKANELLSKLSIEIKLDTFLEVLTGNSYIGKYEWSSIKPFILARNFFIHYKPQDFSKYDSFKPYLSKESILSFLDKAELCYTFLKNNQSESKQEYDNKIECVTRLFEERQSSKSQIDAYIEILQNHIDSLDMAVNNQINQCIAE